jgi:UDP-GlcNAc:undecaprenyl-phosphate/decaprenyl-phosphate GlcNAc-1-phosphate transferase
MIFLSTLLTSVLFTIALIPVLSRLAIRFRVMDIPNERKVHCQPIPRSGGLAMAVGAFAPILFWYPESRFVHGTLAGAGLLVCFGLRDDMRELSPRVKFAGQILAALIVIFWGGVRIVSLGMLAPDGFVLPAAVAMPLTLVAIVGVTNAINLADGLDGLAGGISLLIFSGIGLLAYLSGNPTVGIVALAVAGAIFGFLRYNTYPARVFMGDAGSQLLGFLAITLSLSLTQVDNGLSPLLPLLLLGLPILDTLTVMLVRIASGRSPFAADKNHFHHNLMKLGLRHAESVLVIYLIQGLLLIVAFVFRFHSDWLLLASYLSFAVFVLAAMTMALRRGWRFRRFTLIDVVLAGTLRRLRNDGSIARVVFRFFEYGLPALLLFTCLLTRHVSIVAARAALLLLVIVAVVWLIKRERLVTVLRGALYLMIPVAVYFSERQPVAWLQGTGLYVYNVAFGVLAVLVVIVSRLSRRDEGFRSTPMDFLVLFLALAVPNLPDQQLRDYHLGLVAAKIIILYFSYEVLLAELRDRIRGLSVATLASLAVLVSR